MTIRELEPKEFGGIFNEKIRHGVFLTTCAGDKVNSMWLNWAMIGYIWRRYCCAIYVRPSRFTAELLAKNPEFTISIPLTDEYREALRVCGKQSGRDGDKLSQAGLSVRQPVKGNVPVIEGKDLVHLECRILQSRKGCVKNLNSEITDFFYGDDKENAHQMHIAEILTAYEI